MIRDGCKTVNLRGGKPRASGDDPNGYSVFYYDSL